MSRVPLLKQLRDQSEAQKAQKNFFGGRAPLISGSGCLGPPYLKVWISHCEVHIYTLIKKCCVFRFVQRNSPLLSFEIAASL